MTTKKPATKKTPQRVRIPTDLFATGFVVVAIRFPDDPTAHRVHRVTLPRQHDRDRVRSETRPACRATVPASKAYELTANYADAQGAVACTNANCFGGNR